MNSLVLKLSGEIRNWTLIQFLGILAGLISSLAFYSYGHSAAALIMTIITPGFCGFCDFHIHRNGEYLRISSFSFRDRDRAVIAEFENAKLKHWTTKIVVPATMVLLGFTLLLIANASYQKVAVRHLGHFMTVMVVIVAPISTFLFAFGAHLGKWGWRKK
jgi:hypothetical protein